LLLGLIASFDAVAAQQKGWTYHYYPPRVFALMLLGLAVVDIRRPLPGAVQRIYTAVAFGVLGTCVVWTFALGVMRVTRVDSVRELRRARLDTLVAAVRRHVPLNGSLFVLSYTNESSFPLVNYSGVRLASRFPHLWILEAVYQERLYGEGPLRFHARHAMTPAERYLNDAAYEDLAHHRPHALMVLRHARDVRENALRRLDYLAYFNRDSRIAAELRQYRLAEDVGEYRFYVRTESGERPGAPPVPEAGEYDVLRPRATGARALTADSEFLLHLLIFVVLGSIGYAMESRRSQGESVKIASQGPL
jgi:hypothetical protein